METSNRQITFTPDLFEPVQRSAEDAEKITGSPVGFWGDAWRRLKRNRIAVAAGCKVICQSTGCAANAAPAPRVSVSAAMLARIFFITLIVSGSARCWRYGATGGGRPGPESVFCSGAFKPYSLFNRKKGVTPRMRHFCARCREGPAPRRNLRDAVAFRADFLGNKPRKNHTSARGRAFLSLGSRPS
jgi:hypothetical protein